MIKRDSDFVTNPAATTIVNPSRRDLVNRGRTRSIQEFSPSGKPRSAPGLATSFRPCVSFYVSLKSFWVLSVEITHKTITGTAAFVAAATVMHVAAIRTMRHRAIAATFVNFLGGSRNLFSCVPCFPADDALPVTPVFAISLYPELGKRLRRFARRAILQFRNTQDSLILPLSTHKEVQFV